MPGAGQSHVAYRAAPGLGGAIIFWLLILMGVTAFAPCVLLPEWRQYQELHAAEQVAAHHASAMHAQVERERRMLDAVRTDPGVVTRLAKRDLGYRNVDESLIDLHVETVIRLAEPAFVPTPPTPPALIASVVSSLPRFDADAVFCDPRTRPTVMTLAICVIVAAFVLFGHRSAEDRSAHSEPRR